MDTANVERELVRRRSDLVNELSRLTTPPEQGIGVGFGKRVGDGTTEAVERFSTTATARSISASISEIDRALSKIGEGSYGICESCGETILEQRMKARPASVRCVDCAD